jgi:hypothetical protein
LLDDREHNRSYWVFGTADFARTPVAYPWLVSRSMAVPYGVMLVLDGDSIWGVRRQGKTDEYAVFHAPRPDPAKQESLLPDFAERSGRSQPLREHWVAEIPIRPRAMVRAGGRLVVAGMMNQFDPSDATAPLNATYAGDGAGVLRLIAERDGQTLAEWDLDAPPVWDGMAAVRDRLFIANRAGQVVCYGDD